MKKAEQKRKERSDYIATLGEKLIAYIENKKLDRYPRPLLIQELNIKQAHLFLAISYVAENGYEVRIHGVKQIKEYYLPVSSYSFEKKEIQNG